MDVLAFIAMLIAAIIFIFVPDGVANARFGGRSAIALGLFFLTLGLIFQFTAPSHPMHF